jgi:hypothetical protein
MKTTKAYLAGLGTTGIMIVATLLLVVLGTGFVAFDALPALGGTGSALERVVLDDHDSSLLDRPPRADAPPASAEQVAAADRHRLEARRLAMSRLAWAGGLRADARRAARDGTRRHAGGERPPAGDLLGGGRGTGNGGGEGGTPTPGDGTPGGGSDGGSAPGGLSRGGGGAGGGGSGRGGSGGGGGVPGGGLPR